MFVKSAKLEYGKFTLVSKREFAVLCLHVTKEFYADDAFNKTLN